MHKSIVNNHRKFCNETSNIFWEIAVFVLLFFFSGTLYTFVCQSTVKPRLTKTALPNTAVNLLNVVHVIEAEMRQQHRRHKHEGGSGSHPVSRPLPSCGVSCRRSFSATGRVSGLATRIDEAYGTYIAWSSSQSDCLAADPRRSRWLHCRLCPSPSVPYSSVSAGICRRQCTSVVRVCWFDRCTFTVEFRQHSKVKLLVANTSCF